MEDVNQLFDSAFEFANYPGNQPTHLLRALITLQFFLIPPWLKSDHRFDFSGAQSEASVKELLDRFPLPVIFK